MDHDQHGRLLDTIRQCPLCPPLADGSSALEAEVDQLRAEVDRLRAELASREPPAA